MWRRVLALAALMVLTVPALIADSAPRAKSAPYGGPTSSSLRVFPIVRAPVQQDDKCNNQTKHCIGDDFYQYWLDNGGLTVFGYPIAEEQPLVNPTDGRTYMQQWFERERLELHPEKSFPYNIELGLLGSERLKITDAQLGRNPNTRPLASPNAPNFFINTGHAVNSLFTGFWSVRGLNIDDNNASWTVQERVGLFGFPVTEIQPEKLRVSESQSKTFQTQWFERARFEYHPENPPGNKVQLGLLGFEANPSNDDITRKSFDAFRGAGTPPIVVLKDKLETVQTSAPPLTFTTSLNVSAQNHANYYLANYQLFSGSRPRLGPTEELSDRPNFTGETPQDRAQAAGFQFVAGDEIVAFTDKAQTAVNFWLKDKSPQAEAARNVILNPDNVYMGQGYGSIVLPTGRSVAVFVVDFGTGNTSEGSATDTPTPTETSIVKPEITFTPTFTSTDTPTIVPIP